MSFVRKASGWIGLAAFMLQTCAVSDAATSKRQRHAKAQTTAGAQRVVCGMTGCFDVPPGCRYVIRNNGSGIIAVVLCNRR